MLNIICCPQDGQPLRMASLWEIERINLHINSGTLLNRSGQVIYQSLAAALIRKDGIVAYPVCDDIPLLLVEESIDICDLFAYSPNIFMSKSR